MGEHERDDEEPAHPIWVYVGTVAFLVFVFVWVRELLDEHPARAVAAAGLVGIALYSVLFVWLVLSRIPQGDLGAPTRLVGVLFALAVVLGLLDPVPDAVLLISVGALAAAYLPRRLALGGVATAGTLVVVIHVLHTSTAVDTGRDVIQTFALGFFVYGYARLNETNNALVAAREQVAGLAVENERLRFARDLHDLLGHTLSVIRVKSELAQRLVAVDPARATTEMADVESVAREALTEVRDTVTGYRQPQFADELRSALDTLESVGIRARSTNDDGPELPTAVDRALAWAVREAVTNVVRHSGARECAIDLRVDGEDSTVVLTVDDDGARGLRVDGHGSGLRGIRERVEAVGGTVHLDRNPAGRGARLAVSVPLVPR